MQLGETRREPGVAQIRRSLAAGLLLAAVVLPSAAHAQATLDKISFTRDVARTGHNDTGSTGEIRIEGSGITSATVVLPGATTQTDLKVEAATGDYVLGFTETTQALLDTAFPVGNYTLAVNTDEITGTIGYMPPAVTSPNITFPVHGSSPSPLQNEFTFLGCTVCTDTTAARLTQGTALRAEDTTLDPLSTSWIPTAGATPIELDENTAYVLNVEHAAAALATLTLDVTGGTVDVPYDEIFTHSDRSEFTTSFLAPEGSFTLVFDDPAFGLYVPPATVVTSGGGMDIEYEQKLHADGRITGNGYVDVDGDTMLDGPFPITGRLGGSRGRVRQRIRYRVQTGDPLPDARFAVTVREKVDVVARASSGQIDRSVVQKVSGRLSGARLSDLVSFVEMPAAPDLTWQLDFTIDTPDAETIFVSNAALTCASCSAAPIPLVGSGFFVADKDFSRITLRGQGEFAGISILILKLRISKAGAITLGRVRYKAFGQRGLVRLPLP